MIGRGRQWKEFAVCPSRELISNATSFEIRFVQSCFCSAIKFHHTFILVSSGFHPLMLIRCLCSFDRYESFRNWPNIAEKCSKIRNRIHFCSRRIDIAVMPKKRSFVEYFLIASFLFSCRILLKTFRKCYCIVCFCPQLVRFFLFCGNARAVTAFANAIWLSVFLLLAFSNSFKCEPKIVPDVSKCMLL